MPATPNLLISQYPPSDPIHKLVQKMYDIRDEEITGAVAKLQRMTRIDDAEGVWLDKIGTRLRLPRPTAIGNREAFGFNDAGQPFDAAPFEDESGVARSGIADIAYRKLLKARAQALISAGKVPEIETCCRHIDPQARVQDNQDLSLTLFTDNEEDLQRGVATGAIPVPAGVLIRYAPLSYFGFGPDDKPFDAAPFEEE